MTTREYTIDATGRSLGRVATEAANFLRGKDQPSFANHIAPKVKVTVQNAAKIKLTGAKFTDKYYKHYTGHPGGMRYQTVEHVVSKKGFSEIMRKAVHGMLPDNKLKPVMMKNLIVTE
ncbi:MAG TPA: 50S ribosomal protein L13 [Candidatus Paceibacterota bacterium]|nr:50S ribosomal protein L13 [Candidatus Paceibacterota bacterium]